jgi:cytochrome c553
MKRHTLNTFGTFATRRHWALVGLCTLQALVMHTAHAADTSPAQQLNHWTAQAGAPAKAERGQALFNQRQGGEWSCASCHGTPPTAQGKHASTGKAIAPLAPAFNVKAFTDTAKVDKWFKRNCKDVFRRECSAQEKADVLAYLIQLKP